MHEASGGRVVGMRRYKSLSPLQEEAVTDCGKVALLASPEWWWR
jgi:hypothetical protein